MWRDHAEETIRLNWTAILSIAGSLAVSLALWAGLIRVVALFVK
jgi:hypothetical protein